MDHRESLDKAFTAMSSYDAGGFTVNFGDNRYGTHYVELAAISKGGQFRLKTERLVSAIIAGCTRCRFSNRRIVGVAGFNRR